MEPNNPDLTEFVKCQNPNCLDGIVDTGGMTPWGSPFFVACESCNAFTHIPINKTTIIPPNVVEAVKRATNYENNPQR